jgi:hypothetical protein
MPIGNAPDWEMLLGSFIAGERALCAQRTPISHAVPQRNELAFLASSAIYTISPQGSFMSLQIFGCNPDQA